MSLSVRRPLVPALIVSALIHFALLLSVVVFLPMKQGATVASISVIMTREEHRVAPVKPTDVSSPKPQVASTQPTGPSARKVPKQPVVTTDRAADTFVVPAPVAPPMQEASTGTAVSSSEVVSGTASRSVAVAAPESISTNDLSELRMSLSTAARRFKNYPRLARERGWEGTVDVALVFSAHSPYPDVNLARSSGRAILDEQALELVGRAARATTLPAGLRGREFRVSLPVKFSLEDDQ